MSFIRVIGGDFNSGRVGFDGVGFTLRAKSGKQEYVKFSQIHDVTRLEREWRSSFRDKLTGVAAGGLLGGVLRETLTGLGDMRGLILELVTAVANLISNLQKTGFFRNIEIKETFQDESVKEMQAFTFTLTCEKAKS